MSFEIAPFARYHEEEVVALSIAAWFPVFNELEPAVPSYVYQAFYPQGWRVRQVADVRAFLRAESEKTWVAVADNQLLGWVGIRLHEEDRMGELYILAVHPKHQRQGIAVALIEHALAEMRRAGMAIAMVETGDDPGHAPSRATYERAEFERWPVARYFRKL